MDNEFFTLENNSNTNKKHPKCLGYFDNLTGDLECDYQSDLECDQCKYGVGRKDPEAKCNQLN